MLHIYSAIISSLSPCQSKRYQFESTPAKKIPGSALIPMKIDGIFCSGRGYLLLWQGEGASISNGIFCSAGAEGTAPACIFCWRRFSLVSFAQQGESTALAASFTGVNFDHCPLSFLLAWISMGIFCSGRGRGKK